MVILIFKQYLWVAIAVLVVSLAVTTKVLYDKVQKQDNEIGRLYSNVRQYESLAAGTMAENRVLELKLGDLSHSNDSLVQEIVQRKPLKSRINSLNSFCLYLQQLMIQLM